MAGEKESTVDIEETDFDQPKSSSKKKWIIGIAVVVIGVAIGLLVAHFAFNAFGLSSTSADSSAAIASADTSTGSSSVTPVQSTGTSAQPTGTPAQSSSTAAQSSGTSAQPTGTPASADSSQVPLMPRTYDPNLYIYAVKAGPNVTEDVAASCKTFFAELDELYLSFTASKEPATIDNFLVPYNDYSVRKNVFSNMNELVSGTHPNAAVRDGVTQCQQQSLEFDAKYATDPNLYKKFLEIRPKVADADPITRQTVEESIAGLELSGVNADLATQEKLSKAMTEVAELGAKFEENIANGQKEIQVPVEKLDGLPEDWLATHPPDAKGMVTITTAYPDYTPVMKFCHDRDVRKQLGFVYLNRAYPENKEVLQNLLRKRREAAQLLGFENWAQYMAVDSMTKNETTIRDFLDSVTEISKARAVADGEEIIAVAKTIDPNVTSVEVFEVAYLSNINKVNNYAFDVQVLREYFSVDKVVSGALKFFSDMYGLRFEEVPKPTSIVTMKDEWLAIINRYAVHDTLNGDKLIAYMNFDLYPREGKFSHAAVFPLSSAQSNPDEVVECNMVCNFPDPGKGLALMEPGDVSTYFHEFGHAIHNFFGGRSQRWEFYGAMNHIEPDFIESPSQVMEQFMSKHEFLSRFAVHYKTGETIPEDLVAQYNRSNEAGKGFDAMGQITYADYSLTIHQLDPETIDLEKSYNDIQRRNLEPILPVEGGHMYASFGHLNGYSSKYYTYKWSEVIAKDMFTRFEAEGVTNPAVFKDMKDKVLQPSGVRPAADSVAEFLSRPYNMDAYSRSMAVPDKASAGAA